ncbi:hypothetical protein LSH36_101g02035 [Paralvinella palmiformis]|uniref:Uncharacterized protein n=1 Tax=Paralvinella palmiformis TaxID=53620 RepID=A0AAD9K0Q6_9ANNE|nr:hypothetical protein LSH36_101g02035 [Paralvinella palmiformis]
MALLTAICLTFLHFVCTEGRDCLTLDGAWYNELGSDMILNHTLNGELFGEYRTTVERETGSSGYGHADIIGACPYNTPGATFAFAVLFNNGATVTAWTGLNGSCVIHLQHSQVSFFNLVKRSTYSVFCGLEGTWYNEIGSELLLRHGPANYISGEYRTAVEVSRGSAGTSHSKVYGLGNVYSGETTFALFVVWRHGASVTGWVGQCHLCGTNKTETLEMNWLLRRAVGTCNDNWKATNYGQNSFTRHEQKFGPRKRLGIHTPQQEGEDDLGPDLELLTSSCSTFHWCFITVKLVTILLLVTKLPLCDMIV